MASSSSSQSSALVPGSGSSLPRPCLSDQPKPIIELIYQYLKIKPDFYRFALCCRRVYLSSLSSISWKCSYVSLELSKSLDTYPLQCKLSNLRMITIRFYQVRHDYAFGTVGSTLPIMGCLDLSVSCPLLESLVLEESIDVGQEDFLQAWKPFIAGLSKCRHLKRLRLNEWARPLSGLGSLNQLDELFIQFFEVHEDYLDWINSAVKSLPNLKKVNLEPMDAETMSTLATMPNLVEFDLTFNEQISSAEAQVYVRGLPNLKSLKKLNSDQTKIMKSPDLSKMTALECLYYSVHYDSEELESALACIPTLKRLEIDFRKIEFDWHWIAKFVQNNPQLESIDLQRFGRIKHSNPNSLFLLLKNLFNLKELALDHAFLTGAPFKSAYLAHVTDRGRIRNRLDFMHALVDLNEPIQPSSRGMKRPLEATESELYQSVAVLAEGQQ